MDEERGTERPGATPADGRTLSRGARAIRNAFSEFLALPSVIVAGFLALAALAFALDHGHIPGTHGIRVFLRDELVTDAEASKDLLGAIATGVFTVTSITFALVLLALQQTAGAMTSQVIDQFLRRSVNQLYFGFFVGLTLYALVSLATLEPEFNSVFAVTIALVLTATALYVLMIMLYTTINQIRPSVVVQSIHRHALSARERQQDLLLRTRRSSEIKTPQHSFTVVSQESGYLTSINLDTLAGALREAGADVEVELRRSIGGYVAYLDPVAEIRWQGEIETTPLILAVTRSMTLHRQRELEGDPTFALEQLMTIAWTAVSTAKSNFEQGRLVIRSLRDLLARWVSASEEPPAENQIAVVYHDNLLDELMDNFESLTVVASESMQHQTYADVLLALAGAMRILNDAERERVARIVLTSLSALGEHVLTQVLDDALSTMTESLRSVGLGSSAEAVARARDELAATVGQLNSRSTRATNAGVGP